MSKKQSAATIESLQRLGFSEYEARAYIALVRRNPLSGYELAKEAGVPRPNIYAVLDKLHERGAVLTLETPAGVRYAPVAPRTLMERLGSVHQRLLNATVLSLESLESPPSAESVLNARGYSTLLDYGRSVIREASSDVLIALWPNESDLLEAELVDAEARNVAVTILCLEACVNACRGCHGKAYRYRVAPLQRQRWLIIVADGTTMVAGEITGDDAQAAITSQRLIVELAGSYIRHSIALATLIEDLGPRLDESISPRTQAVLNALSPQDDKGSFIDYMRHLMAQTPNN